MPVRIEWENVLFKDCDFFDSQSAFQLLGAQPLTSGRQLQEFQDCFTPKFQPKAFPMFDFASPATSTTTASDHNSGVDRDSGEWSPEQLAGKECEDSTASEDHDTPCFVPFLDPLDWDDAADGDRRFFVASELVELLSKHGGQLLLSKVGSVLTDEMRLALREMRIRLLTFLKEKPQKKYFRIEGAGGGQVLILRDLRDSPVCEEIQSLDAVRAELLKILAPCRRKNAMLLRCLGSSLSHTSKVALKANRLSLSQFLALEKSFVLRKSHVYLADTSGVVVDHAARTPSFVAPKLASDLMHCGRI
jgi:hypothetical protein